MLDTPLIQFAIDEARAAGIERIVFVSHPTKSAIERYVLTDEDLAAALRARGKAELADKLDQQALCAESGAVVFTMQPEPLGLGQAVLCAAPHVLPGPVAVMLPDDLILGKPGCLTEMFEAYRTAGAGHLIATMEVQDADVSRYGILKVTGRRGRLFHASGMVEKPDPADAPSREAVVGRYVLDASIFDDLARQEPGSGDEIQLTDAIARGAERVGLAGFRFSGRRFDCGSKEGMLLATLALAQADHDCRAVLMDWQVDEAAAMLHAAE